MKIQDIMTRGPACVTPNATVREAAQVMLREEIGLVPVVAGSGDDRLVGVITDRDIVTRCVAAGRDSSCRVRDVMSGDLATCTPTDDVDEALKTMRSEKVRRIPIVDERGTLVGIVAQADVVRKSNQDHRETVRTIEEISEPGGRHAQ